MSSIPAIALNGARAAETRFRVSAENTVNQLSGGTPGENVAYQAQEVVQSSSNGAGPITHVREKDPATILSYAPQYPGADDGGFVEFPNVDIATELVAQSQAKHSYEASLKVLETWDDMQETLLDITS